MTDDFTPFDQFDQDCKTPHKSSRKILKKLEDDYDFVKTLVAGPGISIDATDPANPIITATLETGGNDGSGGLWVKSVTKIAPEPESNDIMYTTKTDYGGVKAIAGNATHFRLVIGALPGANGKGSDIVAYVVPGLFSPTNQNLYPPATGTPVEAEFVRTYVNDEDETGEVDHLEYTVDLTFAGFTNGKAQVVVKSDSNAWVHLEYAQEDIAHLVTVDISTQYTDLAPNRTGFTAGDTVTLEFTADAPVYSIFVWAFDNDDALMAYEPVEYVIPGGPLQEGSVDVVLAVTTPNLNLAYIPNGKLFVSVSRYGQPTAPIQTTSSFLFDQRTPEVDGPNTVVYDYNGSQLAMKNTETCVVTVPTFLYANSFTVTFTGDDAAALNFVAPGPYTITDGSGTFTVTRNTEVDYTGPLNAVLGITNHNNSKTLTTSNNYIVVDIEGSTYDPPYITANGDTGVISYVEDPIGVPFSIVSTVKLSNPTGHVTFDGITFLSGWDSSNGGYTWTILGSADNDAVRGAFSATLNSLTTAAGTAVPVVTGEYTISGFFEQPLTIPAFSATLDTADNPPIDYAPGITILDMAFQELVVDVDYTVAGNIITFLNEAFYSSNATGALFVYVSQTPDPTPFA